jgi:hypothetical protein
MDFAYPLIGDAILLDFAITALRVRNEQRRGALDAAR